MRRITWTVLTAVLIFFLSIPAYSDTCNKPFPQNVTYPFGIKPNNYTNAQMNAHVQAWFDKWRAKYVTQNDCAGAEWRLQRTETGNGITNGCYGFGTNPVENDTVSEGIGYGMVILAYMSSATNNTKAQFDGMYLYFKNHLDGAGLMNWQLPYCSSGGSATDADEDVAFGLLVAEWQWGNATGTNYGNEANTIIGRVLNNEITAANDIKPGDGWDGANPSYFAPYEYKMFATKTGVTRWNSVAQHSYQTFVNYYYNSSMTNNAGLGIKTGLQPNWCNYDGTAMSPGAWAMRADTWWWDAIRHAWRQGYDYVLYGTTSHTLARDNSQRLSYFFKTKYGGDASLIKSQYTLDGTETTYCRGDRTPDLCTEDVRNLPGPEGAVAVAAMSEGDQDWLNECYYTLVTMNAGTGSGELTDTGVKWGTDYFCDILKMQYLLILTGNMPNPMGDPPTPTPTRTVTFGPSPTFTPTVPPNVFDDFETGALRNLDLPASQTGFSAVVITSANKYSGTYGAQITSTGNGWGGFGIDTPYGGVQGYRNFTGATTVEFDILVPANLSLFVKVIEAANPGDTNGQDWSNRNNQTAVTAGAWRHVSINLSLLSIDTYGPSGDGTLDLGYIQKFFLQIDASPNGTIYIDNITFGGSISTSTPTATMTRTRTPAGTLTITPTRTVSATITPYYSPTITPTRTITMTPTLFISATITATGSITPTWTASPYIPADIFDDFETGALKNPSTADTGGGSTLVIANSATTVHAGTRSMSAVTTGGGWAVASIDSPYDGGLGYRDFTGATGISLWMYTTSATGFFIKIVETNGQQWSNRNNGTTTLGTGWQQVNLAFSIFTIDAFSPNVGGDTTLDLYSIKSVQIQWDNPGSKTIYVDDIRFTGMPVPSATFTATRTRTFTPTATPSRTPTNTNTCACTSTFTNTRTPTISPTVQNPTNTFTGTCTPTSANTATFTRTVTETYTRTCTPTHTRTLTPSASATFTSSVSPTSTFSVSPQNTNTRTPTLTATPTFTRTDSPTYTMTCSPTNTRTFTPTFTVTKTPTYTITRTHSITPTITPSWTGTPPTWTDTPTVTETWTNSSTLTVTVTPTYTGTSTRTFTPTFTATGTPTYTRTATPTNTFTLTITCTSTPTMTNTFTRTSTATLTYSTTSTQTATYTATYTATRTFTISPTYSVSPSATASVSPTMFVTNTNTPTITETVTGTPPTVTASPSVTVSSTESRVPSASFTPTSTESFVPSGTQTPAGSPTPKLSPTPTVTSVSSEVFEIQDPIVWPNPYNGSGSLYVQFNPTRACSAVTFKVYTDSFRLVRKADMGSCGAGTQARPVAAGALSGFANGTYYYIITGESDKGPARSRAEKLLIIKK